MELQYCEYYSLSTLHPASHVHFNKDIHNLPKGLSIDQVKMVTTKDSIAFQSHHSYLRNMYPCKISSEGINNKSSEHLHHAKMARHHKRFDLANAITKAKDGYATQKNAKKNVLDNDWVKAKLDIMHRVIKLKFDQNDNIRDKLLATFCHLYEATKRSPGQTTWVKFWKNSLFRLVYIFYRFLNLGFMHF